MLQYIISNYSYVFLSNIFVDSHYLGLQKNKKACHPFLNIPSWHKGSTRLIQIVIVGFPLVQFSILLFALEYDNMDTQIIQAVWDHSLQGMWIAYAL